MTHDSVHWQETMNGITIDCSLDIAVHPANSNTILLTFPGVDGSRDGYKNKYVTIADTAQRDRGVAVVRTSNPFITSFHWHSNFRHIMQYIDEHREEITGSTTTPRLHIMAHSAGASVAAQIAHEYENIDKLLLVNTASRLAPEAILDGIQRTNASVTVIYGDQDPSLEFSTALKDIGCNTIKMEGADHNFSGALLNAFVSLYPRYII